MTYNDNGINTYLEEISVFPILTKEEEIECFKQYYNGDLSAKEKLVKYNLKLVVSIVKKYINYCTSLTIFDLIQEGNLELTRIIDSFNLEKGVKFSTFATVSINRYIQRIIFESDRMIRIPEYLRREYIKLKKVENKLELKLNRKPTIYEISEFLDVDINEINNIYESNNTIPASINAKISEDDNDDEIQYFIANPNDNNPENIFMLQNLKSLTYNLINNSNLTELEKEIIMLRYGINDEPMTYKEITEKTNLIRQKVKSLELKALRKLKETNNKKSIFIEEDLDFQKVMR